MFAKSGYLTHIYSFNRLSGLSHRPGGSAPGNLDENLTAGSGNPAERAKEEISTPDILILDTNSRLDPPEVAYRKVFAATRELRQAGCRQFHNKTCSVFRGNIGAEFDAMLDALRLDFAVVVLGFPKNGRATVDGIHYVHGKKLEDSEFRHDPIHPMRR
ncbi:MAG TPA: four-carbon acid sugar kinase family protein, partial [Anaerolineales bacterium]|nr:four-carbon acid sugar kinase family protein [Anaerolineales bacterium]